MQHERGFHLRRAHAVPRDVNDVVHAAGDPVVSIGVATAPVAGDVVSLEHGVIHALESRVIAVARSRRGGPGFLDGEESRRLALLFDTLIVEDDGFDAEHGKGGGSGLERGGAGERGDHERARLGLPVRVHDRAPRLAHHLVIPSPRLGVDRLADRTEDANARTIVLGDVLVPSLHERAHRGGGGVELVHLVLLADGPAPPCVGVGGHALEHHRGGAFEQGSVDDVRVPRDPADIRRAPVHLPGFVIERVLERHVGADHVPRGGVHDALGFSRRTRRVQHEQRRLGFHPLAVAVGVHGGDFVVPPRVAAVDHRAIAREATEHNHGLHAVRRPVRLAELEGGVHLRLELHGLRAAHHRVARHDDLRLRVGEATANRLRGKSAEDDRVHRADARAGEARDGELDHHGHVEGDGIALLDAFLLEHVGELLHPVEDVGVGVTRLLVGGVALPEDGDVVAVSGGDVPVEGVVTDVGLAALEPVDGDGTLVHVEVVHGADGLEGLLPVKLTGVVAEELFGILDGLLVHRLVLVEGLAVRGGGEIGGGRVDVLLRRLGHGVSLGGDVLHGLHLDGPGAAGAIAEFTAGPDGALFAESGAFDEIEARRDPETERERGDGWVVCPRAVARGEREMRERARLCRRAGARRIVRIASAEISGWVLKKNHPSFAIDRSENPRSPVSSSAGGLLFREASPPRVGGAGAVPGSRLASRETRRRDGRRRDW